MIVKCLPSRLGILALIGVLRLVAPLSFAWLIVSLILRQPLLSPWIAIAAVAEALFYLFAYLPRRAKVIRPTSQHVGRDRLTKKQRDQLFQCCINSAAGGSRRYPLAQWFFSTDSSQLKRENVEEWILWAFFETKIEDLGDDRRTRLDDELQGFVAALENVVGHPFPAGRNHNLTCMRLGCDPIKVLHRPLVYYLIIGWLDVITAGVLFTAGFKHYTPNRWFRDFPWRPWSIFSRKAPVPTLSYWYRPHRSTTQKPPIFLHGMGLGLFGYSPFLVSIDKDVGVLVIELLPISTRMTSHPMLPRPVMLDEFYSITTSLGIDKAVLVSHSYGTIVGAHILHSQQSGDEYEVPLPTTITGYCYIDPIPFLLHFPSLVYAFFYRKPRTASEWMLWYFASRDADVMRTLGRQFFWTENVLFKEDLDHAGVPVGVVLSGKDQLVPSDDIWVYLTRQAVDEERERWASDDGKLEVLNFHANDHAMVFGRKTDVVRLVEVINRLSRS